MITEEQRRALFALREAFHLCESCDVSLTHDLDHLRLDVGELDLQAGHIGYAEIDQFLAEHSEQAERFVGKATPETRGAGRLSWRFRTEGGRVLRWDAGYVQTVAGYRLDWKTCDVWELPK